MLDFCHSHVCSMFLSDMKSEEEHGLLSEKLLVIEPKAW